MKKPYLGMDCFEKMDSGSNYRLFFLVAVFRVFPSWVAGLTPTNTGISITEGLGRFVRSQILGPLPQWMITSKVLQG